MVWVALPESLGHLCLQRVAVALQDGPWPPFLVHCQDAMGSAHPTAYHGLPERTLGHDTRRVAFSLLPSLSLAIKPWDMS